jgi:hypothetical protein
LYGPPEAADIVFDQVKEIGYVSAALIAALSLVGLLYRKLVRPMWRAIKMWTKVAEQLLGDKERGVPSLMEQLNSLAENQKAQARQLTEHLDWHSQTARPNHAVPPPPRRTR